MTAHAMKGDRERCLEAGMDEYVSKPIRSRQLFETLASLLGTATISAGDAKSRKCEIDWTQTLDSVEGDHDLMKTLVEAVMEEAPRLLQAVRDAVESDNVEAIRSAAHALRGSIRNFGQTQASDRALELEQMRGNGNLEDGRRVLTSLETAMAGFLCDLFRYAKKPERGEG
jgi:two-component system sensor histidine kinase/response regulator